MTAPAREPGPAAVPAALRDLLDRPIFGSLGTIRPGNTVQVNPMWFEYDGGHLLFTHTTTRAKYRNLQLNPAMSLLITDPDDPFRYLELRGALAGVKPDPDGGFYIHLARRYGNPGQPPPRDKADRVILVMGIRAIAHR